MAFDLKKMFSTVFILVGFYYLLVSAQIIKTKIIWLISAMPPTSKAVFIVGIILVLLGLIMNEQVFKRIKNAVK